MKRYVILAVASIIAIGQPVDADTKFCGTSRKTNEVNVAMVWPVKDPSPFSDINDHCEARMKDLNQDRTQAYLTHFLGISADTHKKKSKKGWKRFEMESCGTLNSKLSLPDFNICNLMYTYDQDYDEEAGDFIQRNYSDANDANHFRYLIEHWPAEKLLRVTWYGASEKGKRIIFPYERDGSRKEDVDVRSKEFNY